VGVSVQANPSDLGRAKDGAGVEGEEVAWVGGADDPEAPPGPGHRRVAHLFSRRRKTKQERLNVNKPHAHKVIKKKGKNAEKSAL
jgi:hypothetical protein